MPSARFFNKVAEFDPLLYPQDAAGGEVPTPFVSAILVPCCVQQDDAPELTEGQNRRGSSAQVRLFFRPSDPPGANVVQALKVNDRVQVQGRPRPIVLDGPPFDRAGRGVVWEAIGRDVR